MKNALPIIMLALVATGVSCGKSGAPADSALNSDLSLAAQQRSAFSLDSAERAGEAKGGVRSPAHRATGGGGTSAASSTGGGVVMEKHTQRDAAIGAAAGALIGATTSRNKVQGGVIGAVAGGVLGGVIGNNVDKTKKKP